MNTFAPMRIVHTESSCGWGGQEIRVLNEAAGMIRRGHAVTFAHALGISEGPARRFNIGPFPAGGDADTVSSISVSAAGRGIGPSFRAIFDLGDWDRSLAMNAPGQSESPGSPYFGDLAAGWAGGAYFPLAFSDRAVQANARNTLMLVPR